MIMYGFERLESSRKSNRAFNVKEVKSTGRMLGDLNEQSRSTEDVSTLGCILREELQSTPNMRVRERLSGRACAERAQTPGCAHAHEIGES
jgi:hypothetical protein